MDESLSDLHSSLQYIQSILTCCKQADPLGHAFFDSKVRGLRNEGHCFKVQISFVCFQSLPFQAITHLGPTHPYDSIYPHSQVDICIFQVWGIPHHSCILDNMLL